MHHMHPNSTTQTVCITREKQFYTHCSSLYTTCSYPQRPQFGCILHSHFSFQHFLKIWKQHILSVYSAAYGLASRYIFFSSGSHHLLICTWNHYLASPVSWALSQKWWLTQKNIFSLIAQVFSDKWTKHHQVLLPEQKPKADSRSAWHRRFQPTIKWNICYRVLDSNRSSTLHSTDITQQPTMPFDKGILSGNSGFCRWCLSLIVKLIFLVSLQ